MAGLGRLNMIAAWPVASLALQAGERRARIGPHGVFRLENCHHLGRAMAEETGVGTVRRVSRLSLTGGGACGCRTARPGPGSDDDQRE